jgi:hypothetical protein
MPPFLGSPIFDASGVSSASGLQTTTLAESWSHPGGTGPNNCGIVTVTETNNGSASGVPTGTPTCTWGGQSIPYLGSILLGNIAIGGFIAVFAALNVPQGAQTINTSIVDSGQNFGNAFGESYTYFNVGAIGALQTAFGTNGVTSLNAITVPSGPGHTVWGICSNYVSGSYTSLSFTSRQSQGASAPAFASGDQPGSSNVNFNATAGGPQAWAVAALDLLPALPNNNIGQAVQAALR